jgi:hypothetical protein
MKKLAVASLKESVREVAKWEFFMDEWGNSV